MWLISIFVLCQPIAQVEDYLADFLDDSFSTYAEDDSPAQVRSAAGWLAPGAGLLVDETSSSALSV